jgi:hypothetical protein
MLLHEQLKSLNDHVNKKLMFHEQQMSIMLNILRKMEEDREKDKRKEEGTSN